MNKRYIDPEKIDFRLGALESDGELLIPLSAVRAAIAAAPSEDVVKVVRCEGCRNCVKTTDSYGNLVYFCYWAKDYMPPYGYCSRSERMTNNEQAD